MLGTIIKKELLANLLSLRIAVCYAVVFLVVVTSIVVKGLHYRDYDAACAANRQAFDAAVQGQIDDEHSDWYWSYDVQILPTPLSVFAEGFTRSITRPFHVEVSPMLPLGYYDYRDPVAAAFKVYDLSFVTAFILSLLALFISYDSFAGEKAYGTLRAVLAQPVSRSTLILGKMIGGYLSVAVPVLFSVACGFLVLLGPLGITFTGGELLIAMGLIGYFMLFLAVIFMLGILLSLVCPGPGSAMFWSLVCWAAFTFIIPFAGVKLAAMFTQTDLLGETVRQKKEITQNARAELIEPVLKRKDELGLDGDDWSEYLKPFFHKYHMAINDGLAAARHDNFARMQRQIVQGMAFSRLSPAAACVFGASGLCGTGVAHYQDAIAWKSRLRRDNHRSQVNESARRKQVLGAMAPAERKAFKKFPYNPDIMPDRHYRALTTADNLRALLPDAATLACELVLLFMACFTIFIRRKDA